MTMLVLTRKSGESIIINNNIKVTLINNDAYGPTTIGIEAPKHISIDREEIHIRKQQQKTEAA